MQLNDSLKGQHGKLLSYWASTCRVTKSKEVCVKEKIQLAIKGKSGGKCSLKMQYGQNRATYGSKVLLGLKD